MNDLRTTLSPGATLRLSTDEEGMGRAAAILRGGGLVAFATETVYGLGADATSPEAVARIYAAKGRPSFNPLIAHVPDLESALREGVFDEAALALARAFWPGPLTLVVPLARSASVCDLARAGLDSIGLRVPDHAVARALLNRVGRPVAAPSANISGRVSPTSSAHVLGDLDGRIDAVLEAGDTRVGLESTIVACLRGDPLLLRPGGIAREALEATLARPLAAHDEDPSAPLAPGLLASHYAPRARVRTEATRIEPGEGALLFGPDAPDNIEAASRVLNLSPRGDLDEAAANLFSYLRRLDEAGPACIAVSRIPRTGLGEAIADRLSRAAANR